MLSSFFYDDKFGFEPKQTIYTAAQSALFVHAAIGIRTDPDKFQVSQEPVILGVKYDLPKLVLKLADQRKEDLLEEIEAIFEADGGRGKLLPAHASKLRGKLGFGATHFWGKIGRAFLRAITERQYTKSRREDLNDALRASLSQWTKIIRNGKPRSMEALDNSEVDAVICTDGAFPVDEEDGDDPRVGGVLYDKEHPRPVAFTRRVEDEEIQEWIPRTNPIVMIEMFAVIVALATFAESIRNKKVLLMIDSESVLGALVKGYSDSEDMCYLVGIFWSTAALLDTTIYLDRISTDANPADDPSRNKMEEIRKRGWVVTDPVDFMEFSEGLGSRE